MIYKEIFSLLLLSISISFFSGISYKVIGDYLFLLYTISCSVFDIESELLNEFKIKILTIIQQCQKQNIFLLNKKTNMSCSQ